MDLFRTAIQCLRLSIRLGTDAADERYGTVPPRRQDKIKNNGDDYYGIIRECTARSIPSAIIEHCHVDESRDTPYCQTEEDWKRFGREDALSVARYFGLSSTSLGVDYSNEANNLPEVSLQSILPATIRDQTEPDVCVLTLQNADYDTGEVTLEVTATDYDCPMMYYDYSTDGGKTYSELIPWPDLDIMVGTYPDTFTFPCPSLREKPR